MDPPYGWFHALHFLWLILSLSLPIESIPAIAFIVGMAYTTWFVSLVWGMREQRSHFHFEMFFFAVFALMALLLLILGLALPYINTELFYLIYSISIGLALVLVVGALVAFPDVVSDIMLIANLTYSSSKLGGVDVDAAQARLETLMTEEAIYQNEGLNLGELAELVALTPHQLSELINSRYDMGFPRFLRERRVTAAKRLLREEIDTSILAISMMTGFKSQSNFYAAFKEATGTSPGNYRQNHRS